MDRKTFVEAFMTQLYGKTKRRMLNALEKWGTPALGSDVDDCIQEALLLLCQRWDELQDRKQLAGWVYITASYKLKNRCHQLMRKENKTVSFDEVFGVNEELSLKIEEDKDWKQRDERFMQEQLAQIRDKMEPDDYRFLLLYLSGQYNVKDIAEMYGATEGAIWMRKKRILKRVKCALNIANQLMFSLVFAVPHTYTSKGGDNHEGGETPDTNAHTTPNLNNPLPKLSPKGAEVILSSLEGMPPEDVDLFLVEVCLAALGDEPEDSAEAAQAALAEFNARYEAEQRAVGHHRRVSRKAWVVAAIVSVLLLATAVAYALGWMPWLFSLTHSTEHHDVGITTGDPGAIADDCGFMPTGLSAEFDGLLEKHGMHIPLPTWLPEGLIYDSTDIISDDEGSTDIRARFADGRKVVFVEVTKYHRAGAAVDIFLEKDDRVYKELEHRGQQYVVYSNSDRMNIFCYAPPYVCMINARITEDELMKMLESIPERRLS